MASDFSSQVSTATKSSVSDLDGQSRVQRNLCWILFLACSTFAIHHFDQAAAIAIDDTFIYLTTSQNFLAGNGTVLNPGDSHSVSTGPLWTVFLAILSLGTDGTEELLRGAVIVGIALLLVGSFFLTAILQPRLRTAAGLAPLAVFSAPGLTYFSGLETHLAVCLLLVIPSVMYRFNKPIAAFFLLGTAYTARADLAALGLPLAITLGNKLWSEYRRSGKSPWRELALCGLAAAAVPLVWHAYAYASMGTILPQGLHAKSIQGASGIFPLFADNALKYVRLATTEHLLLQISAVVGIYFLQRELWPLLLFSAIRIATYFFLNIADYAWYSYDLIVVTRVCMVFGLYQIARLACQAAMIPLQRLSGFVAASSGSPKILQNLSSGLAIALVLVVFWPAADGTAGGGLPRIWATRWVSDQIGAYQTAADWLKRERSSDLAGSVLLTQEVGVLSFVLPEVEIRDIVGITDPTISTSTLGDWSEFVQRHEPKWLLPMFDLWDKERVFLDSENRPLFYRRVFVASPDGGSRQVPIYEKQPNTTIPPLEPGKPVGFGKNGEGSRYLAGGYSQLEDADWIDGKQNGLFLPVPSGLDVVNVNFVAWPLLGSTVTRQRVEIWQGDAKLLEKSFESGEPETVEFEARVEDGSVRVRLIFPDAVVPASLGISTARSWHSLMMLSLGIEKASEPLRPMPTNEIR